MRLVLRWGVGAFAVALLVSLWAVSQAATPPSGTVGPAPDPASVTWDGPVKTASTAGPSDDECTDSGAFCDDFMVTVTSPLSYWESHVGGIKVTITWASSLNDFDLYVFDSSGRQLGSSAAGATTSEVVPIPSPSGTYKIRTVYFDVSNSEYDGKVEFVSKDDTIAPLGPPSDITFGRATISGIQGNGFESDLRVDTVPRPGSPSPPIYSSVPSGIGSATSWVWRSLDGGKTFKFVPAAAPLTGNIPACTQGGDSELAVDTAGHLYLNDLSLANLGAGRSDDLGRTWTPFNCTSVETTPDDRQWYAVDGDPTASPSANNVGNLYLTYNIVGGDAATCETGVLLDNQLVLARSPAPGAPRSSAGVQFGPSQFVSGPCDEGIMGNVEVSPTTHKIFVIHDDGQFRKILIGRCEAVDFTVDPTGLLCVDLPVANFPDSVTGANFPALAIDKAGNLFAVWEQALGDRGAVQGDTNLYWSSSTDEGDTWTAPVRIPTPGLHTNVFAWAAAGDLGRVDIAWYGTPTTGGDHGPDNADGLWSLYMTQTLNGTDPTPTFTSPIQVSPHHVHRGTMFTLIGEQEGGRELGDFMQIRVGPQGEANISFADSNNTFPLAPHNMFIKQNGGTGVFASSPTIAGELAPVNSVTDPAGEARFEAGGTVSASSSNLDILSASVRRPRRDIYRLQMTISDLRSLAPNPSTGNTDTNLIWLVQWLTPSTTDPNGGRNFFAYMQSTNGGTPNFWSGRNAVQFSPGLHITYPGRTRITGGVSFTSTAPGTINIDVPLAHLTLPGLTPADEHLHSVTASTMTMPGSAECNPCVGSLGGSVFNLIDPAPAFDYVPGTDLSITKSDSPDPIVLGSGLTYTLTVTNNGPDFAGNVVVTDDLPPSVTLGAISSSKGTCTSAALTVTCALGDVNAAETVNIVIEVTPNAAGTITNTARLAVGAGPPDTVAGNDTVTSSTTVNEPTAPEANLSITKIGEPNPVRAGAPLTYTLTVHNAGPAVATNVTLNDHLPGSVVLRSATVSQGAGCVPAGIIITCNLGSIDSGSDATVTIVVAPVGAGDISNSASVSASENDPGVANNSTGITTTVLCSSLIDGWMAYHHQALFPGGVFVATGDVDGDGCDEIISGADSGGGPHVRVFRADGTVLGEFMAYDDDFRGGVRVAAGDVDGDGLDEVITSAGPGGSAHVRVLSFDGVGFNSIYEFMAFDPRFSGGASVAAGDVDGDGRDDIITGAGQGGGPHVIVRSGEDLSVSYSFMAYDPHFTGGVWVASGDVDGDGRDDIITGAGQGGGPHVIVRSGKDLSVIHSFFAYHSSFSGGVFVGAGLLDGDERVNIVTGAGAGGGPHVQVFSGGDLSSLNSFYAYDPGFTGGVRVAVGDADDDGVPEIVAGAGPGGGPQVRLFE